MVILHKYIISNPKFIFFITMIHNLKQLDFWINIDKLLSGKGFIINNVLSYSTSLGFQHVTFQQRVVHESSRTLPAEDSTTFSVQFGDLFKEVGKLWCLENWSLLNLKMLKFDIMNTSFPLSHPEGMTFLTASLVLLHRYGISKLRRGMNAFLFLG